MVMVLGWLFWLGQFMFYQLSVYDLMEQGAELPEGWDSDGAAGVFALYFGWAFSLIYFLPWFVIYVLTSVIRQLGWWSACWVIPLALIMAILLL